MIEDEFILKYQKYIDFQKYHELLIKMFECYIKSLKEKRRENIDKQYQKCVNDVKEITASNEFQIKIDEYIGNKQLDKLKEKIEMCQKKAFENIESIKLENGDENEDRAFVKEIENIFSSLSIKFNDVIEKNDNDFQKYVQQATEYFCKIGEIYNNLTVSKISNDERKSKCKNITKEFNKLKDEYLQKITEPTKQNCEPKYFKDQYCEMINNVYDNNCTNRINYILDDKYTKLVMDKITQGWDIKKFDIPLSDINDDDIDSDTFVMINEKNGIYISKRTFDKISEVSEICGKDVFYFGRLYGFTLSKKKMNKKVFTINIANNVNSISFEINTPTNMIENILVKDELFEKIKTKNGKCVYIFSPKDYDMYNKYMTYIAGKSVEDEVKQHYQIA